MLRRHLRLTPGVILFGDLATTTVSFFLTFPVRSILIHIYPFGAEIQFRQYLPILIPILVVWTIVLQFQQSALTLRYTSFVNELKRVLRTVGWGIGLLILLLYSFHIDYIARSFVYLFGFMNIICYLLEKYVLLLVLEHYRKKGINRRKVLIISDGDNSKRLVDYIQKYSDWGLDIVGFLDTNGHEVGSEFLGSKIIGRLSDLPEVLHNYFIEEVIFALPLGKLEAAKDLLQLCETEGVQARIISDFYSGIKAYTEVETVHGLPIITYTTTPRKEWELFFKRVIDVLVAGIGLIILSPLFVIIAIAIKLTSPGPIFYRWNVVGLNKRRFTSYKFRTMVVDADEIKKQLMAMNEMKGVVFKMKNDPRVTKIGRILRKFSLDELPQLFSVLKGDMSLVGPRPPLVTEIPEFKSWHRRKLSVKPGITCLWQCSGRNQIKDFDEWVNMDLQYIDQWSLWLDFKILLKTIPAVITGRGAS